MKDRVTHDLTHELVPEAFTYAGEHRLALDSFHVHIFNIYTKLCGLERKVNNVICELNLKQEK